MATTTMATPMFSFGLRILTPHQSIRSTAVHFSALNKKQESSISLSSSHCVSGLAPLVLSRTFNFVSPIGRNSQPLTVVCAKGYKMKTHKASAKRFRVTGSGKIMRRRAGKQHLLGKKNTKRKLRLSKVVQVDRSDYNNVIGALPYLKVNRAN
ncbi:Ribosomal protein L35 [Abeliophyllum distichum]|uniref:50S ribosomal protein L35 n=1 Tax=Abeliophyllum distichum TaxID=126358 RepID=A0ABD1P2Y3_9LAMI